MFEYSIAAAMYNSDDEEAGLLQGREGLEGNYIHLNVAN